MQLHQRGVDLLINVLDAADRVEQLSQDEIRLLLKEIAEVMCLMLERDAMSALNGRPGFATWTKKPVSTVPPKLTQTRNPADRGEPGSAD